MTTTDTIARNSKMEDSLANQPIQQTKQYGGSGGSAFTAMAGRYVKSIAFYTGSNSTGYYLQGMLITYDNGETVALGTTTSGTPVTLDLQSDSVARLYVYVVTNSSVFGGSGNQGIGAVYAETVHGQKFCSLPSSYGANTPLINPKAWTLVTTTSNQPCANMVLVGMTGLSGSDIDAVSFYFKSDKLMSHGMTDVNYSNLQSTPETPINVATATASNQTNLQQQMSIAFQESVSSSYTFSTTAGVTAGVSTTVEAGLPFVAKGEIQVSATMSFEVTVGVAKTFSKAFSYSAVVAVEAGQTVQANAVASSYQISGQYSAVMAEVWAHAGAVTKNITGTISGLPAYGVTVGYTTVS